MRERSLMEKLALNKMECAAFMEATEAWYIDTFGVWLDQQQAA